MSEAQNWSRLAHWEADSMGTDRGTEKQLYGLELRLRLRLRLGDPAGHPNPAAGYCAGLRLFEPSTVKGFCRQTVRDAHCAGIRRKPGWDAPLALPVRLR